MDATREEARLAILKQLNEKLKWRGDELQTRYIAAVGPHTRGVQALPAASVHVKKRSRIPRLTKEVRSGPPSLHVGAAAGKPVKFSCELKAVSDTSAKEHNARHFIVEDSRLPPSRLAERRNVRKQHRPPELKGSAAETGQIRVTANNFNTCRLPIGVLHGKGIQHSSLGQRVPIHAQTVTSTGVNPWSRPAPNGAQDIDIDNAGVSNCVSLQPVSAEAEVARNYRITYLIKKFGGRWLRAVYGRVSPSKARMHCRRRWLSEAFGVWRDIWWSSRHEWRMLVRAECHDRYRLWRFVWTAWQAYILSQRRKRIKVALAVQHYERKVLQLAWSGWQKYISWRRDRKGVRRTAAEHATIFLCRQAFFLWRNALYCKMRERQQEQIAITRYSFCLLVKSWQVWRSRLAEAEVMKEHSMSAWKHIRHRLLLTCWKSWTDYVRSRQVKHQWKTYAVRVWKHRCCRRALVLWRQQWQRRLALAQHQLKISKLACRVKLRRAHRHWRHYVILCHYKLSQLQLAEQHHQRKVKMNVVKRFRQYAALQILERQHLRISLDFHQRKVVHWAWMKWLCRCETEEEARLVTIMHQARTHYSKVLLRKSVCKLRLYVAWRRHRKRQYVLADNHFARKVIPLYFRLLRHYGHVQQQQKHRLLQADEFRRENLLACHFYHWRTCSQESQEARLLLRLGIVHHQNKLLHRAFKIWKEKIYWSQCQHIQMEEAATHDMDRLCSFAWSKWRDAFLSSLHLNNLWCRAVEHNRRTRLLGPWMAWRKLVAYRRGKQLLKYRATRHWSGRLLCHILRAWRAHAKLMKAKRTAVAVKVKDWNRERARSVLREWLAISQHHRIVRLMYSSAREHCSSWLLRRTFQKWKEEWVLLCTRREVEDGRVRELQLCIQQGMCCRVLLAWHAIAGQLHKEAVQSAHAVQLHSYHLCRRHWLSWRRFCQLQLKKKLLQRQANHHYCLSLTLSSWRQWHTELAFVRDEKQKTVRALCLWSRVLEFKVFSSWKEYVQQRRHHAERYRVAMERRRASLLHTGVAQWLKVGTHLSAQRRVRIAQDQAKLTASAIVRVQRCAAHWRRWARQRAAKEGHAVTSKHNLIALPGQRNSYSSNRTPLSLVQLTARPTPAARAVVQREECLLDPARAHSSFKMLSAVELFQKLVADRQTGGQLRVPPRRPAFVEACQPAETLLEQRVHQTIPSGADSELGVSLEDDRHCVTSVDAGIPSSVDDSAVVGIPSPVGSSAGLSTVQMSGQAISGIEKLWRSSHGTSTVLVQPTFPKHCHQRKEIFWQAERPAGAGSPQPLLLPPAAFSVSSDSDMSEEINSTAIHFGRHVTGVGLLRQVSDMQTALQRHRAKRDELLRLIAERTQLTVRSSRAQPEAARHISSQLEMMEIRIADLQAQLSHETPLVRQIEQKTAHLLESVKVLH